MKNELKMLRILSLPFASACLLGALFWVLPVTAQETSSETICEFVSDSEYLSQRGSLVAECSNNANFYLYYIPEVDCESSEVPVFCLSDLIELKEQVERILHSKIKPSVLAKINDSVETFKQSSKLLCDAKQEAYESASMWNMTTSGYMYVSCINHSQDLILEVMYAAKWASI